MIQSVEVVVVAVDTVRVKEKKKERNTCGVMVDAGGWCVRACVGVRMRDRQRQQIKLVSLNTL